jgi:hypothetical protein
MFNENDIDSLKDTLDMLTARQMELATMCRLDQVAEMKVRISILKERLNGISISNSGVEQSST